ncbi:MAG TPA: lysine--tRNA ligase [Dehalococcoidia bacterium]|nr:lysine--tRNA ligase [Dehalococcoidia bacterium]
MPDREETLLGSRQVKLDRLRQQGIDPYPPRLNRSCDTASAVRLFEAVENDGQDEATAKDLTVAGRIVSVRNMGKAAFLDIRDSSGTLQVLVRQNTLGDRFEMLKDLDVGDHLGVTGSMIRTRTGQVTIDAQELTLAAKGMRPLPEKFHGLRDVEIRYRQRYLDLISNPEIMEVFTQRSKIIRGMRRFLDDRGFLEVDTPVLVPVAAGANARPFVTHHNALDQQLYLRIATELYLKRLIIGGFDKVYELGRVFRNEGIDQDHNPEFTLLESYEAYADYNDVLEMVESMVSTICLDVRGTTEIPFGEHMIDFAPPWQRLGLREALISYGGIDIDEFPDHASLAKRATELGLEAGPRDSRGRLIDQLISTFVEPKLIQPTFLMDYPEEMSPLAKAKPEVPGYVERFEAFAAGMEIANSYTELNDPAVQRERLDSQEDIRLTHQDEEVDRKDEDFLLALEYGMPPTGGLGMGIDRLVMLLSSQPSIRDVMLFPQMRSINTDPESFDQSIEQEEDKDNSE